MCQKLFARVSVTLAAAALFFFGAPSSDAAAFKNVKVGDTPPAIAVKDLAGKEWKSADLYGTKATVVVFWATWSPRSAEVLRDLEALRKEVGADKLDVVTVNCEHPAISSADRDAIAGVAKEVGLSGPVLVDDGLVAFNDYGAMALPSSLVVGADGKVASMLSGYPTTLREDFADAVRKAAGVATHAEARPVMEYVPKNHALMYYNLGRQLASKGQDEKAEAQFALSVEKDPDFKKPHVELGLLLKKRGAADESLKHFLRAKEIDPKDHEALYQVAVVTLLAGKFADAEKLFADLLAEFPEREEIALGLALAQKYQGREDDYRATREKAAKLYPAEARVAYEMGKVAESQKDVPVTVELYRRALETALAAKK